jgi:uncharacterized protein
MKMVLLGVTGYTGQSLMKQALAREHTVIAIARDPTKISLQHPNLHVIRGDVMSASSLSERLKSHVLANLRTINRIIAM